MEGGEAVWPALRLCNPTMKVRSFPEQRESDEGERLWSVKEASASIRPPWGEGRCASGKTVPRAKVGP